MIGGGRVLGSKLGTERFDRPLGIHDFANTDADEIELHRQRLGEQPRIAMRHARPAALAHADVGNAERLQRAQRVAGDDAADAVARRQFLLGPDAVAGLEPLFQQARRARRQRSAPTATPSGRREIAGQRPGWGTLVHGQVDFSLDIIDRKDIMFSPDGADNNLREAIRMSKQRISYVPLDQMSPRDARRNGALSARGDTAPGEFGGAGACPGLFLVLCQFLARHLPKRRARSFDQGAVPALCVPFRAMRILRQSTVGEGDQQRQS